MRKNDKTITDVTSAPRPRRDISLDGTPITLAQLDKVLFHPIRVAISDEVRKRIESSFEVVQKLVASEKPVYGINTGFGTLCRKRISQDQLLTLQRNLIISHAVGTGDPVPRDIVRWMILFKIHALTHGVSGVATKTIDCMAHMLEADVLPVIPTQGSLGASGDLAPLSHMVLPMIGEGVAQIGTDTLPATEAFQRAGIERITLGPKEGLALINGTQFMSAYAAHIVIRAKRLTKLADIIASMSLEGFRGSVRPFAERLHALRPHPGAIETAGNLRAMLADSEIVASHADCDRVQDPYSLRCIPQVHGAIRDAIRHIAGVIETEINSVTDNPIVFADGEVISGGLFHGEPLALVLDYLAISLAEFASISERRVYQLLSGADGLPELLMRDAGVNSGFMLLQYTSAALVSENKGLCTPASVDSIPTSLGQEDHVSMGARAAVKCLQVLVNTETALAIELACAAQALDYRAPLRPGIGPRTAYNVARKHLAHADVDRLFGNDIQTALSLVRSQRIQQAVEAEIGELL